MRSIVALGVLAALAATSNAAIVINLPGVHTPGFDGYSTGNGTAVIDKPSLSDYSVFSGPAMTSIGGSFTFKSTVASIVKVDTLVKTNGISLGVLSFDADITGGPSVYTNSAIEAGGDEASIDSTYQTTTLSLAPNVLYTMNWSAGYTGIDADSYAYITQAVFVFTESGTNPVPEPASLAALGVGAMGLIARRRKGSK